MSITGVVVLLSMVQAPASAPVDSPFAPGGGPPMIGVVERIDGDKLVFRFLRTVTVAETVTVPETVTAVEGGKTVAKTVYKEAMVTRSVQRSVEEAFPLDGSGVYDLDAKPVPRGRLGAIFAKPCVVLYWYGRGSKVDPAYLKVARPGVVFVSLPPSPPVPVPAAVPAAPR